MPKKKATSVDSDRLHELLTKGADHPLIEARLEFAEPDQLLKIIKSFKDKDRVYTRMLPTQASGRWSTTGPPRTNFPPDCVKPDCSVQGAHTSRSDECLSVRDIIVPDPGTYWVKFDYDAIESKIDSCYADDLKELESYRKGWDVHTLTACSMFGLPEPFKKTKELHSCQCEHCVEWRVITFWDGSDDRRRHIAKTMRYSLIHGSDEFAVLNARDIQKLKLTKDELLMNARKYLAATQSHTMAKRRDWDMIAKTGEARTALGRRRKFVMRGEEWARWKYEGKPCGAQREGRSHMISGTVSDVMNLNLIEIFRVLPEAYLDLNAHDGAQIVVPASVAPQDALAKIRPVVEREWEIHGHKLLWTAEFGFVYPDGRKVKAK